MVLYVEGNKKAVAVMVKDAMARQASQNA